MRKLRPAVALFVLAGALFTGVTAGAPAARADDWYRDPCFNATWEEGVLPFEERTLQALPGRETFGSNDEPRKRTFTTTYSGTVEATISGEISGSVSIAKVVEIGAKLGYSLKASITVTRGSAEEVSTEKGEFKYAEQYIEFQTFMAYRSLVGPSGKRCGTSYSTAKMPFSHGICVYSVTSSLETACLRGFRRPVGRGPSSGGTTSPTPPGPQPVTDVRGLADGTLLATSDTKRIYKMVGGAPVWQATCADNICQGQPRPTTQAVVDAGPATPRNGATAIDQRGQVFMFVGGAPLWQDTCAAPVSCGTPVKVSDWSIDARDHMNRHPADGHLVQAKAGNVDLPVAVTVGGALIPFASPQEVVDSGYGADWRQRVTAISDNSYNHIGFDPRDGTLIQGAADGVSTPVAMIVGNAIIPFANPQEVIDVGYGTDWASKVRGVPARVFNSRSRIPTDNTLIQGTGGGVSTPVAAVIGGARINFASPQELIDTGHGTDWASKVRAIPIRAFNEIREDVPRDGTLVQGTGGTPVAKIAGGARVNFASPQEVVDAGYGTEWARHVRAIPGRAFDRIGTTIGDGVLLKKPGGDAIGAVVGGAWVQFWTMDELLGSGYRDHPVQLIPGRVLDALPTTIGDGVRIGKAGHPEQGAVVGGAKVQFWTPQELEESGYADKPLRVIPARVWDALPTTIGDGVRIGKAGHPEQGAVVGGAKVQFWTPQELEESGYADKPLRVIPARVWDALPTTFGDGTRIKAPDSSAVWVVNGGRKSPATGGPAWTVPARIVDATPTA